MISRGVDPALLCAGGMSRDTYGDLAHNLTEKMKSTLGMIACSARTALVEMVTLKGGQQFFPKSIYCLLCFSLPLDASSFYLKQTISKGKTLHNTF